MGNLQYCNSTVLLAATLGKVFLTYIYISYSSDILYTATMAVNNKHNFEQSDFNCLQTINTSKMNVFDSDKNPFYEQLNNKLEATYLNPEGANNLFRPFGNNIFSSLHANIRSINKNFNNFKELLHSFNHLFSVICLTETWSTDKTIEHYSVSTTIR